MIPNKAVSDGFHIHQRQVLEAFDRRTPWAKKLQAWCFWMEWARRHRKTTLAVNLLIREACRYERAKYLYTSPYQAETRLIVWDDPTMLSNALPDKAEMDYKLNETKMLIKFANGSMIKFGGTDNYDSIRGVDAIGTVCDEKALQKEEAWTEILLPVVLGPLPPHLEGTGAFRWVMNLYTPKGINHATIGFDKACCLGEGGSLPTCGMAEKMKPGHYASRLDAEEAGIMTPEALQIARDEATRTIYEQEFRCSRITQEEMTLITSKMLNDLNVLNWEAMREALPEVRKIVAIDPAFEGDVCKIKGMVNGRVLVDRTVLNRHYTHEVVFEAKLVAQEIGTKNFIVDCIGNGKGVADGLRNDEAEYYVQYFHSSATPTEKRSDRTVQFANQKSEAYYYTAEEIRQLKVEPIKNKELLRQLPIASMYRPSRSGKLLMLLKPDIKKLLGCSPDEADCYVYGRWGLKNVEPEAGTEKDGYQDEHENEFMQMSL